MLNIYGSLWEEYIKMAEIDISSIVHNGSSCEF